MRKAIARSAAGREVSWPLDYVCVNGTNASASVELKSEPQADGSQMNFRVDCSRGQYKWTCELQESRSARLELNFGQPTTFELTLPLGFDMQRVKPLLARAHEVGTTLTAEQACGYSPRTASSTRDDDFVRAFHDVFGFSRSTVIAEIQQEPSVISVEVDFNDLEFEPDPNDAAKFTFRCWNIVIIVA